MVDFEKAVEDMNVKLADTLTDEELIEVYGLYKQATVGDINIGKPADTDLKVSWMYYTEFPIQSFIEVFRISFREFPRLVGRYCS